MKKTMFFFCKVFLIFTLIALSSKFLILSSASAQDLGLIEGITGYEVEDESGATSLEQMFSNTIAVLTIIGGLMFIVYFVLGGLTWITAGGKPDKVEKAQKMMTNAAIGLIVVIAAFAIIYIIGDVLGIRILEPGHYLETFWD